MPQIEVDIDLHEIDSKELMAEIERRISRFGAGRKQMTADSKWELKEMIEPLYEALCRELDSLEDQMKSEHMRAVWDKYPSWEMEKRLPK